MKLTVGCKDLIIKAVMEETFAVRIQSIEDQEHALAMDIYTHTYAPYLKAMSELPHGFLPRTNQIAVKLGTNHRYLNLGVSAPVANYSRGISCDPSSVFTLRSEALDKLKSDLSDDRKLLNQQLVGLLAGCSTDKKLLEVRPEAVAYLPVAQKAANLPAVPVDDIRNSMATMKRGSK